MRDFRNVYKTRTFDYFDRVRFVEENIYIIINAWD